MSGDPEPPLAPGGLLQRVTTADFIVEGRKPDPEKMIQIRPRNYKRKTWSRSCTEDAEASRGTWALRILEWSRVLWGMH
jgi:hypothetical protein